MRPSFVNLTKEMKEFYKKYEYLFKNCTATEIKEIYMMFKEFKTKI